LKVFAYIALAMLVSLGGVFPASAQIEWSGFFDILYSDSQEKGDGTFDYGQFEVDLSVPLSEYISAEGALAYDAGVVGLGAGFVDFHLFGTEEGYWGRGGGLAHSGLIVGQFDVPFGIDYRVIPSIDRKLVTPPLVNEQTIDSWNDWGVQAYGATGRANVVLFGVNGFTDGQAIGGRIGIAPLALPGSAEPIEIGGSYAMDMNADGEAASTVLGADVQASWKSLAVKGEYLSAEDDKTEDASKKHAGLYVQGTYDFEAAIGYPMCSVVRYGMWSPDYEVDAEGTPVQKLDRLTVGLGVRIAEGVEIRCELQKNGEENVEVDDDVITFQVVVGY